MSGSRKAMSGSLMALIAVIIVVILIILLIVLFKGISDAGEEEARSSRCKASVIAYARINSLPDIPFNDEATSSSSDINCPAKYVTIEDEGDNQVRREIANLLAQCWDDFGRGKLKLFRAEDEKFCVVCSVFQFEDRSVRLTGLPSFLMVEKSPYYVEKKRVSYQEFMTGVRTNDEVVDRARSSMDQNYFDGSKRYAIMFTYYKQSYWSRLEGGLLGLGIAVVGGIIGAAVAVGTFGAGAPVAALIITGSAAAGAAIGAASTGEGVGGGWASSGADWDAQVVISEYDADRLREFGCDSLPVSQLDERFK
ncbi:hypothetical protein JW898_01180 [Candidatus Woesearchaeota archaeon]|nr:hypothetical protein [Candidatus Woesearchaeota archaeon]